MSRDFSKKWKEEFEGFKRILLAESKGIIFWIVSKPPVLMIAK